MGLRPRPHQQTGPAGKEACLMNNLLHKRLASLLCVKSIVTLVMAAVFAFSVLTDRISGKDFLTVFSVIIAFYFGTQSERLNGMLEKEQDS